jgi:hypothetical protein
MRTNALPTRILPLLIVQLLAGCGGGGSSEPKEPAAEPVAVVEDVVVGGERSVSNPEADAVLAGPANILACGGPGTVGYATKPLDGTNTQDVDISHGRHRLQVRRGVVPAGAKFQPWLIPDRYNRAVVHLLAFPGGAQTNPPTDGGKRFRVRIAYGPCGGGKSPSAVIRLEDGMTIPTDSVSADAHVWFSTDQFSTYAVVRPEPGPECAWGSGGRPP